MSGEERSRAEPGWAIRNRWKLVLAAAAVAGGFWWARRGVGCRIRVEPVSEHWLAEHLFDAGQPSE